MVSPRTQPREGGRRLVDDEGAGHLEERQSRPDELPIARSLPLADAAIGELREAVLAAREGDGDQPRRPDGQLAALGR